MNRFSFIPRWLHSTSLMVLLLTPTASTALSQNDVAADDSTTKWYRHVFQIQKPGEVDAFVGVSAPAKCQIWLNGQRLTPRSAQESPVAYQVGPLLRSGANCLAFEDRSKADVVPVSLQLSGRQPDAIACRQKATQPPVGWQKTDFNDRDWEAVKVESSRLDWAGVNMQPFKSEGGESRLKNSQFRFRNDDHVVLLGGTFVERAQQFGHLEAALMASGTDGVTFRNLGWSADTVFAESRGIFDAPAKGYARMIEHLRAEEPDVVLIAYGQNEAMQETSERDFQQFQQQLNRLITDVRTTGAEVVLVTPHPFLKSVAPLPDARKWNAALARYAQAILEIARKTDCHSVNMFADFELRIMRAAEVAGFWPSGLRADDHVELRDVLLQSLSDNGMHWNDRGYRCVSMLFADSLLGEPSADPGREHVSDFARWELSLPIEKSSLRPGVVEMKLPYAWLRPGVVKVRTGDSSVSIGSCRAMLDGQQVALDQLPAEGPSGILRFQLASQYDQLLQLLVKKNELYFHRWRPQNITYLFGFRKHEQGNNASDIARFDPLIAELEQRIQLLKNSDGPTVRLELK